MAVQVISKVSTSQALVNEILCAEEPLIVLPVTFKFNKLTAEITLVALKHNENQTLIFDVQKNPKLWINGDLVRLLQAERVVKIIHDCRAICNVLRTKHNITTNTVFDTQVAYSLEMEMKEMTPRLIDYVGLYENITGGSLGLHPETPREERRDANYWSKRPISELMMWNLDREVQTLKQEVYPIMLRNLDPDYVEEFERRCHVATRGQRSTADQRPYVYTPQTYTKQKSQIRVKAKQKPLLPRTQPLTSEHPPYFTFK